MDITEVSILHHIALVLLVLSAIVHLGWAHPFAFFVALLYLYAIVSCISLELGNGKIDTNYLIYIQTALAELSDSRNLLLTIQCDVQVNAHYTLRLQKRVQLEERKYVNQQRLLSDTESLRWLNHAIEKVWPICMEQIASQQFLLPIIPWFLDKYKPWTAKKAVMQHLYLGRNPPVFTDIRVFQSADDDHLVLELGMDFLSADDMSAKLAVQLRKRLGFGITANMHITGMHVEGKILVGVKFLRQWPFIGRVRVCFLETPYFQMTVKPLFRHGVDVTELPGIYGWLDKLIGIAFGQTLVKPNMLVVDVEKFVSTSKEACSDGKEELPIGYVKLEIIEGADMKPSDLNRLSDPYVKGQFGALRFRTRIQRKTLYPRWLEEFKIPITSWGSPNILELQVHNKDIIFDDILGSCSVNVNNLRGGQRHDMWLPLHNIKMGRIHLAITVVEEAVKKDTEGLSDDQIWKPAEPTRSRSDEKSKNLNTGEYRKMTDEFEVIDIRGQEKAGVWVYRPGTGAGQKWEHRKGRVRPSEIELHRQDSTKRQSLSSSGSHPTDSGSDEETGDRTKPRLKTIKRGIHKLNSVFRRKFQAT